MKITPYSKVNQLKGKRKAPKRSQRGRITPKEYRAALNMCDHQCCVCGTSEGLEAHHVIFRGRGGRNKWRNIRFLCANHHRGDYSPHKNAQLRKELEGLHEHLYGPHYFKDEYDLHQEGLISEPTEKAYEEFMVSQQ